MSCPIAGEGSFMPANLSISSSPLEATDMGLQSEDEDEKNYLERKRSQGCINENLDSVVPNGMLSTIPIPNHRKRVQINYITASIPSMQ
jgi:hypothetical protein